MTPSPPAPTQSESRGLLSARFAPLPTVGREVFCWCIGIQLLVLLLSFAGSPASLAIRTSVAAASAELLVPLTEFSPANDPAPAGTAATPESAPTGENSLTDLPETVEAVAAGDVSIPDIEPADLLNPLPAPAIQPARSHENPRPQAVATSADSRPTRTSPPAAAPSNPNANSGGSGTGATGSAQLFSGGGTGRFPLPPYPTDSKRRGIEGRVMLRVAVGSDGAPGVPVIESSSGHSVLDRAALDWIKRRWRWESGPPRLFRIPIIFKLQ